MQNTTLDVLGQLTPTQSLALVAAVLALACVAWMSIRLVGALARVTICLAAAVLFIGLSGVVPLDGLPTTSDLDSLKTKLAPMWTEASDVVSEYTVEVIAHHAVSDDTSQPTDEDTVKRILGNAEGPGGHP